MMTPNFHLKTTLGCYDIKYTINPLIGRQLPLTMMSLLPMMMVMSSNV